MFARVAIFAALMALTPPVFAACDKHTIELRQDGVQAQFTVELAITPAEQGRGLMFRETLPQFSGMLFINKRPRRVAFWMKNTLIPLDMFFIDHRGVVQRVHRNAVPLDTTPIPGGDNIQYVLEVNGGLADLLHLSDGAEVRYIGFDQENAVWPCEE